MKKKVSMILVLTCLGLNVFAENFSAKAPSGQELWYVIRSSLPNEVMLTYPSNDYRNPYAGFPKPSGDLEIPETVMHNGTIYKVTAIGGYAFYGCEELHNVIIPNGVGTIYSKAFGACTSANITISERVKSFAKDAFEGCNNVKDKRITKPINNSSINKPITQTSKTQASKSKHTSIYTSEQDIKDDINKQDDGIVGIYRNISTGMDLAVVPDGGNSYTIVYVDGNEIDWSCGDRKAELYPSATIGLFQAEWYMNNYTINNQCLVVFDGSTMKVAIKGQEITLLKMYPAATAGSDASKSSSWSGSGFAIAANYVVTNNHVVDGAKYITVKGVKGDLTTSYSAKVVATDVNNDIAIVKIDDNAFAGFGIIPYGVSSDMASSGDDVFVLGYPLSQALGNEIKLTNGIVSSRTGYQGDIATYQISAPVQPGNSGGPMFDSKGNVIGIVVAGVPGAENVGYAIKTSYLKILIESAGLNIHFPTNTTISALSLPEKVKRIKNFVYYIECSK